MKPTIQFAHANGFPAETYSYFFEQFPDYDFEYVPVMGHGKYGVAPNWKPLGHELIEHIEAHKKTPVVGIGHSMGGAATMYAAYWKPHLFKKIIFIDPPLFPTHKRLGFDLMKKLGTLDKVGPSGRAKTRKTDFDSYEAAFEYFKPKRLFKNFHERCFEDYVKHGLKSTEDGKMTLRFSKEIEYQVFRNTAYLKGKVKFKMPSYFIYSSKHEVLQPKDIEWLQKKYINTKFISFDGGHLFPLEKPKVTADLIMKLIEH